MMYGQTQRYTVSRFVREIPDDLKEIIDKSKRESFEFGTRSESFGSAYNGSFKTNTKTFTGNSYKKPEPQKTSLSYNVGDMVSHRIFGDGMVVSLTPMANDTLVEVSFDKVGTKKIMANFAKLTKK